VVAAVEELLSRGTAVARPAPFEPALAAGGAG
jgi:hypothetical protein